MSFKYIIFHWFVHLFLALMLVAWLRLELFFSLIVFLSTIAIDFDHLPITLKEGLKEILKFTKPRRYFFHNLLFLVFFILLTTLPINFSLKLIFLSLVLHLSWDLFEDVLILKIGIKHWFIKRDK
ncbi:MAG: hypothetical protein NZ942_00785 [Candidatus Aenigmarchaeota archaeon]|nr:hypothetical protein [Candidatus Aenigmarchaeota archaeon]